MIRLSLGPPLDVPRVLGRRAVAAQPVDQLLRLVARYAGAHRVRLDRQDVGTRHPAIPASTGATSAPQHWCAPPRAPAGLLRSEQK